MIHKNEITEITQFFNSLTTKKSFLLINQHTNEFWGKLYKKHI